MDSAASSHGRVETDRSIARPLSSCAFVFLNILVGCSGTDRAPFAGPAPAGDGGATLARPDAAGGRDGDAGRPRTTSDACTADEICNGVDDNCDGVVDEGCPTGISIGAAAGQVVLGASEGGAPFTDACAPDEILVGLEASAGFWLDHVRGVCRPFSLAIDTSASTNRYRLASRGPTRSLDLRGEMAPAPTLTPLVCPDNHVMIALRVSQDTYMTFVVMPKVWVTCASLSIEMEGGMPQFHWRDPVQLGPLAGFYGSDAGDTFLESDALEGTTVPVRFVGAAGSWIDRIGYGLAELFVATVPRSTVMGHK